MKRLMMTGLVGLMIPLALVSGCSDDEDDNGTGGTSGTGGTGATGGTSGGAGTGGSAGGGTGGTAGSTAGAAGMPSDGGSDGSICVESTKQADCDAICNALVPLGCQKAPATVTQCKGVCTNLNTNCAGWRSLVECMGETNTNWVCGPDGYPEAVGCEEYTACWTPCNP